MPICRTARLACFAPSALALAVLSFVAAPEARAVPVSFGDSTHYWDGYANLTSDDAKDTIGTPDLFGGTAEIDGGLLTSVTIDYRGPFSLTASGRGSVVPGDLFIDAGADGDWDYVVKIIATPHTQVTDLAHLQILDVSGEAESYLMSGSDDTGHFRGFLIRDRHPYAWNGGGAVVGSASLTMPSLLATGTQSLGIDLGAGVGIGGEAILAFAPSCANDVIFERISAPVPEPGAALVFAAGLFVVARRRPRR